MFDSRKKLIVPDLLTDVQHRNGRINLSKSVVANYMFDRITDDVIPNRFLEKTGYNDLIFINEKFQKIEGVNNTLISNASGSKGTTEYSSIVVNPASPPTSVANTKIEFSSFLQNSSPFKGRTIQLGEKSFLANYYFSYRPENYSSNILTRFNQKSLKIGSPTPHVAKITVDNSVELNKAILSGSKLTISIPQTNLANVTKNYIPLQYRPRAKPSQVTLNLIGSNEGSKQNKYMLVNGKLADFKFSIADFKLSGASPDPVRKQFKIDSSATTIFSTGSDGITFIPNAGYDLTNRFNYYPTGSISEYRNSYASGSIQYGPIISFQPNPRPPWELTTRARSWLNFSNFKSQKSAGIASTLASGFTLNGGVAPNTAIQANNTTVVLGGTGTSYTSGNAHFIVLGGGKDVTGLSGTVQIDEYIPGNSYVVITFWATLDQVYANYLASTNAASSDLYLEYNATPDWGSTLVSPYTASGEFKKSTTTTNYGNYSDCANSGAGLLHFDDIPNSSQGSIPGSATLHHFKITVWNTTGGYLRIRKRDESTNKTIGLLDLKYTVLHNSSAFYDRDVAETLRWRHSDLALDKLDAPSTFVESNVNGLWRTALDTNAQTDQVMSVGTTAQWDKINGAGSGYKTTFSCWIKPNVTQGHNNAHCIFSSQANSYGITILPNNGKLVFFRARSGTNYEATTVDSIFTIANASSQPRFTTPEWTHVAIVYDASSNSNQAIIYINGYAVATTHTSPTGTPSNDSSASTTEFKNILGASTTGHATSSLRGLYADFIFFSEILDADQVHDLYLRGNPSYKSQGNFQLKISLESTPKFTGKLTPSSGYPQFTNTRSLSKETIGNREYPVESLKRNSITVGTAAQWDAIIGDASGSTKKISFSVWINKTGVTGAESLLFDIGNIAFSLMNDDRLQLKYYRRHSGTDVRSFNFFTPTQTLEDNVWYHVAFTYDASSYSNHPRIYINGNLVNNPNLNPGWANTHVWDGVQSEGVYIGQSVARPWPSIYGKIAEPAIWNSVLEHTEIAAIYESTRNAYDNDIGTVALNITEAIKSADLAITAKLKSSDNNSAFIKLTQDNSLILMDGSRPTVSGSILLPTFAQKSIIVDFGSPSRSREGGIAFSNSKSSTTLFVENPLITDGTILTIKDLSGRSGFVENAVNFTFKTDGTADNHTASSSVINIQNLTTKLAIRNKIKDAITNNIASSNAGTLTGGITLHKIHDNDLRLIVKPKQRFDIKCPSITAAKDKTLIFTDTTGYRYNLYFTALNSDSIPSGTIRVSPNNASATATQVATALQTVIESLPTSARTGTDELLPMAANSAFNTAASNNIVSVVNVDFGQVQLPFEITNTSGQWSTNSAFEITETRSGNSSEAATPVLGTAISNNFLSKVYNSFEFTNPVYDVPDTGQKILENSYDGNSIVGPGDPRVGDTVVRYDNQHINSYLNFFDNLKTAISSPTKAGHMVGSKQALGSAIVGPTADKKTVDGLIKEGKISLLLRNSDAFTAPSTSIGYKISTTEAKVLSNQISGLATATMTIGDGSSSRVITFVNSSSPAKNQISTNGVDNDSVDKWRKRLAEAINDTTAGTSVSVTAKVIVENNAVIELTHDTGGTVSVSFTQNSASVNPTTVISSTPVSTISKGLISWKSFENKDIEIPSLNISSFSSGYTNSAVMSRNSSGLTSLSEKTIVVRLFNNESSSGAEGIIFTVATNQKSRYYLKADQGKLQFRVRPSGAASHATYWQAEINRNSLNIPKDKWYTLVISFNEIDLNITKSTVNYMALYDSENHGGLLALSNFVAVSGAAASGGTGAELTLSNAGVTPRLFIGYGNATTGVATNYSVHNATATSAQFYNNFSLAELSILNECITQNAASQIAESHLVLRRKSGFRSDLPKRALDKIFSQPEILGQDEFVPFEEKENTVVSLSSQDVIYPAMSPSGVTGSIVFNFTAKPTDNSGFSLKLPDGKDFQIIFNDSDTNIDGFTKSAHDGVMTDGTDSNFKAPESQYRFHCGTNNIDSIGSNMPERVKGLFDNLKRYSNIPIKASILTQTNSIKLEYENPGSYKGYVSGNYDRQYLLESGVGFTASDINLSNLPFGRNKIEDFTNTTRDQSIITGFGQPNIEATISCSILKLQDMVDDSRITPEYIEKINSSRDPSISIDKQLSNVQSLPRSIKDTRVPKKPVIKFSINSILYSARLDNKLSFTASNKYNIGTKGIATDNDLATSVANSILDSIVKDNLGVEVSVLNNIVTLKPSLRDQNTNRVNFNGYGVSTTSSDSIFETTGFNKKLNPEAILSSLESLEYRNSKLKTSPYLDSDKGNSEDVFYIEGVPSLRSKPFSTATRNKVRIEIDINPVEKTTLGFTTGSAAATSTGFTAGNYNPMGYFNFGSKKWESISPNFSGKIETDRTAAASSTSRNQAIYDAVENFQDSAPIGFGGTYGFSIHRKNTAAKATATLSHVSGSFQDIAGAFTVNQKILISSTDQTMKEFIIATRGKASTPNDTGTTITKATNIGDVDVASVAADVRAKDGAVSISLTNPDKFVNFQILMIHLRTAIQIAFAGKITCKDLFHNLSNTWGTVTETNDSAFTFDNSSTIKLSKSFGKSYKKAYGVANPPDLTPNLKPGIELVTSPATISIGSSGTLVFASDEAAAAFATNFPEGSVARMYDGTGTADFLISSGVTGTPPRSIAFSASTGVGFGGSTLTAANINGSSGWIKRALGDLFFFRFTNNHYRVYELATSDVSATSTQADLVIVAPYSTTTATNLTSATLVSYGHIDTTTDMTTLELTQESPGPSGNTRIRNGIQGLNVLGHARSTHKIEFTYRPDHGDALILHQNNGNTHAFSFVDETTNTHSETAADTRWEAQYGWSSLLGSNAWQNKSAGKTLTLKGGPLDNTTVNRLFTMGGVTHNPGEADHSKRTELRYTKKIPPNSRVTIEFYATSENLYDNWNAMDAGERFEVRWTKDNYAGWYRVTTAQFLKSSSGNSYSILTNSLTGAIDVSDLPNSGGELHHYKIMVDDLPAAEDGLYLYLYQNVNTYSGDTIGLYNIKITIAPDPQHGSLVMLDTASATPFDQAKNSYTNLKNTINSLTPYHHAASIDTSGESPYNLTIKPHGDHVSIYDSATSFLNRATLTTTKSFLNHDTLHGKYSSFSGGILTGENDLNRSDKYSDFHYSELNLRARPISNFGFPFSDTYKPSENQKLDLSKYLDGPFLLEKFEIICSSSIRDEVQEGLARLLPESKDDLPYSNYGSTNSGTYSGIGWNVESAGWGDPYQSGSASGMSYLGLYDDRFRNLESQRLYDRFYPHTFLGGTWSCLSRGQHLSSTRSGWRYEDAKWGFHPMDNKSAFTKERLEKEGAYHRVGGNIYAREAQAKNALRFLDTENVNTHESSAWWRCDTFFLMREKPCIDTKFSVQVPGAQETRGPAADETITQGNLSFSLWASEQNTNYSNNSTFDGHYWDQVKPADTDGVDWYTYITTEPLANIRSYFGPYEVGTQYIEITSHSPKFNPGVENSLTSGRTYVITTTVGAGDNAYMNTLTAGTPFDGDPNAAVGEEFVANTTHGDNSRPNVRVKEKEKVIRIYIADSVNDAYSRSSLLPADPGVYHEKRYDGSLRYAIDIQYLYGPSPIPYEVSYLINEINGIVADAVTKGYLDGLTGVATSIGDGTCTLRLNNATLEDFTNGVFQSNAKVTFSPTNQLSYLYRTAPQTYFGDFLGSGIPKFINSDGVLATTIEPAGASTSPTGDIPEKNLYDGISISRSNLDSFGVEHGFNITTQSCSITNSTRELITYSQVSYYGYAAQNSKLSDESRFAHYYFLNEPGHLFYRGKDHTEIGSGSNRQTMEHPHLTTFGSFEVSGSNKLNFLENGLGRELNIKIGSSEYIHSHDSNPHETAITWNTLSKVKFSVPKKISNSGHPKQGADIFAEDGSTNTNWDSPSTLAHIRFQDHNSIELYEKWRFGYTKKIDDANNWGITLQQPANFGGSTITLQVESGHDFHYDYPVGTKFYFKFTDGTYYVYTVANVIEPADHTSNGLALDAANSTAAGTKPKADLASYGEYIINSLEPSYNLHDGILRIKGFCKSTPKLDSYFPYRLAVLDQYENPTQASLPKFTNVSPTSTFVGGYDFDGLGGTRARFPVSGDKPSGVSFKVSQMPYYLDDFDRMDPTKSVFDEVYSTQISTGNNFEKENAYILKPTDKITLGFQTAVPGFHSGFTSFTNLGGGLCPTELDDQGNLSTVHTTGERTRAIDTGKCIEATFAPYEKSKLVLYGSYIQNNVPKYPKSKKNFESSGVVYDVIGEEQYDVFDLSLDSEFSGSMSSEIISKTSIFKNQDSLNSTTVLFGQRTNDVGGSPKKLLTTGSVGRFISIYKGDELGEDGNNHDLVYWDSLAPNVYKLISNEIASPGKKVVPSLYLTEGTVPSLISNQPLYNSNLALFVGSPMLQKNVYYDNTLNDLYTGLTALNVTINASTTSINFSDTKAINLAGIVAGVHITITDNQFSEVKHKLVFKVNSISSATVNVELANPDSADNTSNQIVCNSAQLTTFIKVTSAEKVDAATNLPPALFDKKFFSKWRTRFIFQWQTRDSNDELVELYSADPADNKDRSRNSGIASFGFDTKDENFEFQEFSVHSAGLKIFQNPSTGKRNMVVVHADGSNKGNIEHFTNRANTHVAITNIKAKSSSYQVTLGDDNVLRTYSQVETDYPAVYTDQVNQVDDSPFRQAAAMLFGYGSLVNKNLATINTGSLVGYPGNSPLGTDTGHFDGASSEKYKLIPEQTRQTLEHPIGVKYGMMNYDHLRPKVIFNRNSFGQFSDLVQGRKFSTETTLSGIDDNAELEADLRTVPVSVTFVDPNRRKLQYSYQALRHLFSQNLDRYYRTRVPFFDDPNPNIDETTFNWTEGEVGAGSRVRREREVSSAKVSIYNADTGEDIFNQFLVD